MDVEIFRRTVKDRRRGASWELLQHMAEGIRACLLYTSDAADE